MNKLYVPRYPESKYHLRFCLQILDISNEKSELESELELYISGVVSKLIMYRYMDKV